MRDQELKKILKKHGKWLNDESDGEKADLREANLAGVDLREAKLCRANLREARLYGANLYGADLSGADLTEANLCGANLYGTNLRGANLCGANLNAANLRGTNLSATKNVPFLPMVPPESGSFIGWKKAEGKIVKLLIPEDARRSSATSRKCRCDKAKVLAIENLDGKKTKIKKIASAYDKNFVYEVGKTVKVPDFCENRWQECAPGIHFFVSRRKPSNTCLDGEISGKKRHNSIGMSNERNYAMTKRERHEIAVVVKTIMNDECDEIRRAYRNLNGNLVGLRNYVRKECVAFWTNCDPYLDKAYLDYAWIEVDWKIVNLDDCWCFIRDGLEFEIQKTA